MILSDTSIRKALAERRLVIDPNPTTDGRSPYSRSSVDLRLGQLLRVPKDGLGIIVDPASGSPSVTLATLYDSLEIPPDGFVLKPGRLVLGITLERVKLPLPEEIDRDFLENGWLAARVEGKSSLARYGLLVHFTAPTIHAGFDGQIALEIMNLGPSPINLTQELAICQLILEQVDGAPGGQASQFAGQTDPAGTP